MSKAMHRKKPICPKIAHGAMLAMASLLLVACLAACGASGASSTSSQTSSSSSSSSSVSRDLVECDWGYFEVPDGAKGKLSVSAGHGGDNGYFVFGAPNGGGCLARVVIAEERQNEDEGKKNVYSLGEFTDDSGSAKHVELYAYYVDEQGNNVHWSKKDVKDLGIETLCSMSPEELVSCIFIRDVDGAGFTQAAPELVSTDLRFAAPADSVSTDVPKPFWGVWGFASKNESECADYVKRLKSNGYYDAGYYLTTDWSNLNSEPWYVVSVGKFDNEADAREMESMLNAARNVGDVYAKYTGEYRGNQ